MRRVFACGSHFKVSLPGFLAKPIRVQQKVVDHTLRTCHAAEGRTVYDENGRSLGMISDVCFSLDGRFLGFVLEQKRLFHNRHLFLEASDIKEMEQEAVASGHAHLRLCRRAVSPLNRLRCDR